MAKPRLISLFSGIGGIDLAFEQAGFEVVCQVENNSFCIQVLEKHWSRVQRLGDIRYVRGNELPAADVMAGGFPCQDISNAGNRAGIKEGNRSGLWFEFARLIGEFRPAVVFLENVPAITTNGGTTVLESLAALRYDAEWGVVAAADMGAPHRRERWFCLAYPAHSGNERGFGASSDDTILSGTAMDRQSNSTSDDHATTMAYPSGARSSRPGYDNPEIQAAREPYSANGSERRRSGIVLEICGASMGDTDGARLSCARIRESSSGADGGTQSTADGTDSGRAEPRLGRMSDGLSAGLDEHRWPARPGEPQHNWEPPRTAVKGEMKHRADRLRALGNAVVPQVIYPFAVAIRDYLENKR